MSVVFMRDCVVIVFFDCHVLPQVPPVLVVFSLSRVPTEHSPSPLVNQITKWKEGDLSESHCHQEIQVTLCKTTCLTNKAKRFEPIEISQFLGRFRGFFSKRLVITISEKISDTYIIVDCVQ